MKQILVIADLPENNQYAFEKALELAKRTVASIHILVFCHESFGMVEEAKWPELQTKVMARYKQWWENYLTNHTIESRVSYEVLWQKHIHHSILEHCKKAHYDLIVKTGRRSESFFHTPTDWQLFRHSHTPVYSVATDPQQGNKVILVALDLMSRRKEKQALNKKLLEAGFQLAMQTNASLHCCYNIEISHLLKDIDLVDVDEEIKRLQPKIKATAAELMDTYDIDDQHLHISHGTAWVEVTNLARELEAGCIVIGTMGRSGIVGKLIGNTSEQVIQHLETDVLVIGPD